MTRKILVAFFYVLLAAGLFSCGSNDNDPIANAGTDQNVVTGTVVTLDGSNSDGDGELLVYNWSFVSTPLGSNAALSDAAVVRPTFTADVDGVYVVQLVVNDSLADTVTVTAATANSAPVANAGADQSIATGSLVTLDGSASSDANGDLLSYNWSFVSRPALSNAALSAVTVVGPTFTADVDGDYVLQLMVNDGALDSLADMVTVTAATANSAPVADAGSDQSVNIGSLVTLDGSASSDVDNDPLNYAWSIVSVPSGSALIQLTDAATDSPSFTPDIPGDYVIRLVVNDGALDSVAVTVTITASSSYTGNAYTWIIYSNTLASGFAEVNLSTGDITLIKGDASFMAGADFVGDRYLAVDFNNNSLNYVKSDGTIEVLGTIPGMNSYSITGLAYDQSNDILYITAYDGLYSRLYSIDPNTASATLIGNINTGIIIGIAADNDGTLYGVDIYDDALYSIDAANGTGTYIGPLGDDFNYAQDIGYDRVNRILYGTLYNSTGGGLYSIDITNGTTTLIGQISSTQLAGLAIPY